MGHNASLAIQTSLYKGLFIQNWAFPIKSARVTFNFKWVSFWTLTLLGLGKCHPSERNSSVCECPLSPHATGTESRQWPVSAESQMLKHNLSWPSLVCKCILLLARAVDGWGPFVARCSSSSVQGLQCVFVCVMYLFHLFSIDLPDWPWQRMVLKKLGDTVFRDYSYSLQHD